MNNSVFGKTKTKVFNDSLAVVYFAQDKVVTLLVHIHRPVCLTPQQASDV